MAACKIRRASTAFRLVALGDKQERGTIAPVQIGHSMCRAGSRSDWISSQPTESHFHDVAEHSYS